MADRKPKVEEYYNQVAEDYERIYRADRMSYKNGIGDYFRLQILLRLMAAGGVRSAYEVGVGDGTPLFTLHQAGIRVAGCDIAPNMVKVARERFQAGGVAAPDIALADVENSLSLAPQLSGERYDAVIALGVMPHVRKERLALDNMRMLVREGGKLYIEFRNSLFSLFTFNRLTHDFVTRELLRGVDPAVVGRVSEELKKVCHMDKPPVRDTIEGKSGPGYDLLLAKFHNPLEVPGMLAASGFRFRRHHWYHFHAAPPWMADGLGDAFDEASVALEHRTDDWRGLFLCSAVLVEADAVAVDGPAPRP